MDARSCRIVPSSAHQLEFLSHKQLLGIFRPLLDPRFCPDDIPGRLSCTRFLSLLIIEHESDFSRKPDVEAERGISSISYRSLSVLPSANVAKNAKHLILK